MIGAKIELSPGLTIEIEIPGGSNGIEQQMNIIEACSFWQQLPSACPMPGCGAPLVFFARHPQTFHYYGLKCTGPKTHEMNLSERKDKTSFYIKGDAWKDAYHQDGDDGGNAPATTAAPQSTGAPAQASPSGGQITQPTIIKLMRLAAQKQAGDVPTFVRQCAAADPALTRCTNIQDVKELTEAEANAVIVNLNYL